MLAYRVSKQKYVASALLGEGAARVPGRWNSAGVRVAYLATSVSLAMLEILVHVDSGSVPQGLRLLGYQIPDAMVATLPQSEWPAGWDDLPYNDAVRAAGDGFIAGGAALALLVPSAVAQGEFNVLVNPEHRQFDAIALASDDVLAMDPRLFE